MSILTKMLKQTAVYWAPDSMRGDGTWTFDDPIEIKCRWQDTQEQFIDKNGQVRISSAKVFVDRDLKGGGFLWQGSLVDLESTNPKENEGAYEIMKFGKMPNLKATKFLRTAIL
jgi:hypothetical protein